VACNENDLEVNVGKYMVKCWEQNSKWSYNIKVDNSAVERAEYFKYLW